MQFDKRNHIIRASYMIIPGVFTQVFCTSPESQRSIDYFYCRTLNFKVIAILTTRKATPIPQIFLLFSIRIKRYTFVAYLIVVFGSATRIRGCCNDGPSIGQTK